MGGGSEGKERWPKFECFAEFLLKEVRGSVGVIWFNPFEAASKFTEAQGDALLACLVLARLGFSALFFLHFFSSPFQPDALALK